MSNEFTTLTVGEIGKVRMCKRVLKEQTSDNEEIPFYKISTFGDKPDTFITKALFNEFVEKYSYPKKGDILISAAGTVGKTVIFDGKPSYFQDSNIVWVDNNEDIIINKYLYYFYQTKPWQTTNGSTITRIYNDDLKSIKITFPKSISKQQKIASVLSALDDKIELNNRINTELEAMAKTIYDYWFVQFDFPDLNGKPYKSSGGKMVYNDVLKREVPEGWEVSMLAEHLNCNKNNIGKNHELETINYLDTSSLTENRISFLQKLNVKKDIVPSRAQRIVTNNDILISTVRPNLRHFGLIKRPAENMIASTGFALLNHKTTNNYNDFFYMYITSDAIQKKLESVAASSVSSYPSINPTDILDLAVPLPKDFGIIDTLSKTLSSFFTTISVNQEQNQQLSQLRDWLLPMLMNGQVSVADAYQQAAQALSMAAEDAAGYGKKK